MNLHIPGSINKIPAPDTKWRSGNIMGGGDMKKVFVAACVIAAITAVNAYASPAVDKYIQAIASLPGPNAKIPAAPKGCGAVRDQKTGDIMVLVPREYCETKTLDNMLSLGQTKYGSQITGYCQEF